MMTRVIVTIYPVDDDGLGKDPETYIFKIGEEFRFAHPLEVNISAIVIDRIEEAK